MLGFQPFEFLLMFGTFFLIPLLQHTGRDVTVSHGLINFGTRQFYRFLSSFFDAGFAGRLRFFRRGLNRLWSGCGMEEPPPFLWRLSDRKTKTLFRPNLYTQTMLIRITEGVQKISSARLYAL